VQKIREKQLDVFVDNRRTITSAVLLSMLLMSSVATAQVEWDRVEGLLLENDCRRLGVLYSHYVDLDQADKVADLFTETGVFSMGEIEVVGRKSIRKLFIKTQKNKDYISKHLLSNTEIARKSKTLAEGRSYVAVFNYPKKLGSGNQELHTKPVASAQYEDKYALSKNGCLIEYRKVIPVFLRKQPSIK